MNKEDSGSTRENCLLDTLDQIHLQNVDLQLKLQTGNLTEEEYSDSENASGASEASLNIITETAGNFNDIRGIFSPKQAPETKDTCKIQQQHGNASDCELVNRETLQELRCDSLNREIVNKQLQHDQREHDENVVITSEGADKKRKVLSSSGESDLLFEKDEKCEPVNNHQSDRGESVSQLYPVFQKSLNMSQPSETVKTKQRIKKQRMERGVKGADGKEINYESLEVDARTIVELNKRTSENIEALRKEKNSDLEQLKTDIQQKLKREMSTIRDSLKDSIKKEIEEDVQKTMEDYQKEIAELKEKVEKYKSKANVVSDVIQYNHQLILDLSKRLDNVEMGIARRSAILTGLSFSEKKWERLEQIHTLLHNELGVYVDIEDTYTLGEGVGRPVVIIFDTAAAKSKVFENKHLLK